jgi:hypothetical protein
LLAGYLAIGSPTLEPFGTKSPDTENLPESSHADERGYKMAYAAEQQAEYRQYVAYTAKGVRYLQRDC